MWKESRVLEYYIHKQKQVCETQSVNNEQTPVEELYFLYSCFFQASEMN